MCGCRGMNEGCVDHGLVVYIRRHPRMTLLITALTDNTQAITRFGNSQRESHELRGSIPGSGLQCPADKDRFVMSGGLRPGFSAFQVRQLLRHVAT